MCTAFTKVASQRCTLSLLPNYPSRSTA
jgi:hypothetical protein